MGTAYYICGCRVHVDDFSDTVMGVQPCEIHGKDPTIESFLGQRAEIDEQIAARIRVIQEERLKRDKATVDTVG